jgi:methyl-accepting chemotaxis protein
MIRTLPRTLLVVLATAASFPATAPAQPAQPAQPAATARAGDPPLETLTTQDREALAAAQALATELSQVLEQWITSKEITADRLFARLYFPLGELKTDPKKYTTPYSKFADRDLVGPEDMTLAGNPAFVYAILTDSNGYVPAYNQSFAQPLTGDIAQDYVTNRTKRLLGDLTSLLAARSERVYLRQHTKLETGDEIYDLSVPVTVRGKHWGCVRVGYRRSE